MLRARRPAAEAGARGGGATRAVLCELIAMGETPRAGPGARGVRGGGEPGPEEKAKGAGMGGGGGGLQGSPHIRAAGGFPPLPRPPCLPGPRCPPGPAAVRRQRVVPTRRSRRGPLARSGAALLSRRRGAVFTAAPGLSPRSSRSHSALHVPSLCLCFALCWALENGGAAAR